MRYSNLQKLALLVLVTPLVGASSVFGAGEFSVSPAHRELYIQPGQTKTFSVSVINTIGRDAMFSLGSEDVEPSTENGEPELMRGMRSEYSIKDFVSTPYQSVIIKDGETLSIPITVSIPEILIRPSIYGVVTIGLDNQDSQLVAGAKLQSRIGVGVFVRTTNILKPDGHVASFSTATGESIFGTSPVTTLVSYSNDGNIYLTPGGTITLRNIFGMRTEVKTLTPWYVLPGSVRSATLMLGSPYSFGRYTALLRISDGLGGNLEEVTISYWITQWKILTMAIGLIFVFFILRRSIRNFQANSLPL